MQKEAANYYQNAAIAGRNETREVRPHTSTTCSLVLREFYGCQSVGVSTIEFNLAMTVFRCLNGTW